jgi:hypothetical protein
MNEQKKVKATYNLEWREDLIRRFWGLEDINMTHCLGLITRTHKMEMQWGSGGSSSATRVQLRVGWGRIMANQKLSLQRRTTTTSVSLVLLLVRRRHRSRSCPLILISWFAGQSAETTVSMPCWIYIYFFWQQHYNILPQQPVYKEVLRRRPNYIKALDLKR